MPDDAHLHALRAHNEGGGQDGTRGIDVEVGKVVLVDQGPVKPEIFAESPLVEVLAVRLRRQCRVTKPIGQLRLRTNVVRNARVGGLIEGVKLHLPTSSSG